MDSLNISISWTPPPLSSLMVDNCDAATEWAAALIRAGNGTWLALSIPMNITTAYLRSMIPRNWTSQPTTPDLLVWSFNLWGPESPEGPEYDQWLDKAASLPINHCGSQICRKLDWQGDPDVSGIGVRATSIIVGLSVLS